MHKAAQTELHMICQFGIADTYSLMGDYWLR
jgi:hypothetical protein